MIRYTLLKKKKSPPINQQSSLLDRKLIGNKYWYIIIIVNGNYIILISIRRTFSIMNFSKFLVVACGIFQYTFIAICFSIRSTTRCKFFVTTFFAWWLTFSIMNFSKFLVVTCGNFQFTFIGICFSIRSTTRIIQEGAEPIFAGYYQKISIRDG